MPRLKVLYHRRLVAVHVDDLHRNPLVAAHGEGLRSELELVLLRVHVRLERCFEVRRLLEVEEHLAVDEAVAVVVLIEVPGRGVARVENFIGREGESAKHMMRSLEIERLTLAAMSLGITLRCVEVMVNSAIRLDGSGFTTGACRPGHEQCEQRSRWHHQRFAPFEPRWSWHASGLYTRRQRLASAALTPQEAEQYSRLIGALGGDKT